MKLLQLIEPLRQVFLEGKITAGHAILLARLSAADQKLVSHKDHGGLYQSEDAHFEEIVGKSDGYKLRSVRELQQYIDEHCRFVAERDADPMLFPETAELLKSADPKKKSDKIVAITHGYVQPDARHGEKHIAPTSWKRADGKQGSKPCDFSVIGVVVAGEDRAKAFRVCINKEKCTVHWGEWQKARAKRTGTMGLKTEGLSNVERERKEKEARAAQEAKAQEALARWERAVPAIANTLAAAIKKAPAKATGVIGELVLENLGDTYIDKDADKYFKLGSTAEDVLRYIAFQVLYSDLTNRWGDQDTLIVTSKRLGVDVKKLVSDARVQTSAPKPAKKK